MHPKRDYYAHIEQLLVMTQLGLASCSRSPRALIFSDCCRNGTSIPRSPMYNRTLTVSNGGLVVRVSKGVVMSRILVGAVAVLALGGTSAARAADSPVKAPPVEVFSWAGFYAGLNAGGFGGEGEQPLVIDDSTGRYFTFGAGQNANVAAVMGVGNQRLSNSGFTGGGQIGYNFHKPGSFGLLGFEADVQWLDPSTTSRRQSFLPP